jgi:hypothetical protein
MKKAAKVSKTSSAGNRKAAEKRLLPVPPGMYFGGIITQTVTKTNDPGYFPGQVFCGYYQYKSLTVDGDFYATGLLAPTGNNSLTGLLYRTLPAPNGALNSIPSTMNDGNLKVAGGIVTAFTWSWQMGSLYVTFDSKGFNSRVFPRVDPTTGAMLPSLETSGTVTLSPPMRQG